MNGRPYLEMLDWELLQRLRGHLAAAGAAAGGTAGELAARLAAEPLPATDRERRLLALLAAGGNDLGPSIMAPMRLRTGTSAAAGEVAALLLPADPDPGEQEGLLARLAAVDPPQELFAPYWLLLAFASEDYRFCVLGLAGEFDGEVSYDGDPVLLRATGGLVPPGFPVGALHPPAAVAEIAAGLARIDLAALPDGDLGALQQFYEDLALGSPLPESLEQVGRAGIDRLRAYYQEAAGGGRAVRVYG